MKLSSGWGRFPASAVEVRNGGNSRPTDLPQTDRVVDPGEAMLAEVHEVCCVVADQSCGHIRHHDLAAVTRRHDPRRTVQRPPEVVAVTFNRSTGVQAHAYRQPAREL